MEETTNIEFGKSTAEVRNLLGTPKKESTHQDMNVLWYESINPLAAQLYYFRDDRLVLKTFPEAKDVTLQTYFQRYGNPDLSAQYYPADYAAKDRWNTTLHLWPSQGVDVVTYGNTLNSPVFLVRQYAPTELVEYLSGLGSEFRDNQPVSLFASPTVVTQEVERVEVASDLSTADSARLLVVVGFWPLVLAGIGLIVAIIAWFLWRRRRIQRRGQTPTTPAASPTPVV